MPPVRLIRQTKNGENPAKISMFTFHWNELFVIVIGGLVLILGLAFLMLRRRNDLLQDFLTPEEPDIEAEFFRVRKPKNAQEIPFAEGTNESKIQNQPGILPEQPAANQETKNEQPKPERPQSV
jgi:LPXTG-motif cell wall-anchored protein